MVMRPYRPTVGPTALPKVHYLGCGAEPDLPARLCEAPAPIGLLRVHEESLVQQPDFGSMRYADALVVGCGETHIARIADPLQLRPYSQYALLCLARVLRAVVHDDDLDFLCFGQRRQAAQAVFQQVGRVVVDDD